MANSEKRHIDLNSIGTSGSVGFGGKRKRKMKKMGKKFSPGKAVKGGVIQTGYKKSSERKNLRTPSKGHRGKVN